jgi:hypothetical protein
MTQSEIDRLLEANLDILHSGEEEGATTLVKYNHMTCVYCGDNIHFNDLNCKTYFPITKCKASELGHKYKSNKIIEKKVLKLSTTNK